MVNKINTQSKPTWGKIWKLLLAGALLVNMTHATASYAQSEKGKEWFTKEEIKPVFNMDEAKIKELEEFFKLRMTLEEDITRKLKAEGTWSKDIDKWLVSKPKPCGTAPNIILINKREDYKDCLITAIKQEQKRIDELAALLPDIESTEISDTIQAAPIVTTTSDSTSTALEVTDTIVENTNDKLKNTDIEGVTKLVEEKLKESEPAVKVEKVVKKWVKKDGEAIPF